MVKSVVTIENSTHPLEEFFDIEPGSTPKEVVTVVPTELVVTETYDEKDGEIEKQFQEVYDAAMVAFDVTTGSIDSTEPKYRARNEEVAVQYLNTALAAAREKSLVKQHKDKMVVASAKATRPGTVNNNLIVADRNEILKQLMGKKEDENS